MLSTPGRQGLVDVRCRDHCWNCAPSIVVADNAAMAFPFRSESDGEKYTMSI